MHDLSNSIIEANYDALAKAIITTAAEDYKSSRFLIDTIDMRKYKDDSLRTSALNNARREVKCVELFFKDEWFHVLSGLDGEKAFRGLKATYVNEYYPMRMSDVRIGKSFMLGAKGEKE